MKDIEKLLKKSFEQKKVPTGVEICEKQLFNLVDRVENVEVDETQIEQFLPVIYKKLDWLSREDLIKRFVSVEFNRFLAYYKNANDLNVAHGEEGRKRTPKEQFMTFKINVGFQDGINPPRLIGLINEQTRNRNIEVGKIEIGHNYSYFEIDKNFREMVLKSFQDAYFEGVRVAVKESAEKTPFRSKEKPSFRSKEKPSFRSKEKPSFQSKEKSLSKSKFQREEKPESKPKAWEDALSNDWSKDKKKGKSKDWSQEKPRRKSGDKPKESYGGKKKKRSPYKNW